MSLESGRGVISALKECGYEVSAIDVRRDIAALVNEINSLNIDVVFNSLHGRYGEDGCIQGLLDMMGVPYTHSGRLASAIAMDKPTSKRLFEKAGIPIAKSILANRDEVLAGDVMERPYVIKPGNEGSSVGVRIVTKDDDEKPFEHEEWSYGDIVMVEKFIAGRELTVAILDGEPLGVLEIKPNQGFYDYTAKYTEGKAEHVVPAEIPEKDYQEALRLSALAHKVLGCKGLTRADFRYDGTNLYILEINTQPGMTPLSLAPEIAANAGISYNKLVQKLIESASCEI